MGGPRGFGGKKEGFRGFRVEKGSMSGAAARTGKLNEKNKEKEYRTGKIGW